MQTEFSTYNGTTYSRPLAYLIKGLAMGGAVLHLGTHPDDEDVGLLSYLSQKYGVRAVYWSATRGEGGQNRINGYQNEALGILRTWESQSARDIDGGECLFGPFFDFGFCKNADKAFSNWDKERVVKEIVRAIRQVQPQVVIARWRGGPEDGHGQHQAIGIASREAFELSGQAGRFPELEAEGLVPWQPAKYYCSTLGDAQPGEAFESGKRLPAMEQPGVLRINTGELNPVSGLSYQENAWLAFNQHQSQGLGMVPLPGDFYCYFLREAGPELSGDTLETSIYEGLDPELTGLADYPGSDLPQLRQELEEIVRLSRDTARLYRVENPLPAANATLAGLTHLENLVQLLEAESNPSLPKIALCRYLTGKIGLFEEVAWRCLGLTLETYSDRSHLNPGSVFQVFASMVNPFNIPLENVQFSVQAPVGWSVREVSDRPLELNPSPYISGFEITTAIESTLSSPYWLAQPRKGAVYHVPGNGQAGLPFNVPSLQLVCRVNLGNDNWISIRKAVTGREPLAGGFRRMPPTIIPPISLLPETSQEFVPVRSEAQSLRLRVAARNNRAGTITGELTLQGAADWQINPDKIEIRLPEPESVQNFVFTVTIPANCLPGHYPLNFMVSCEGRDYNLILNPVYLSLPGSNRPADSGNCLKEEIMLEPAQVMVHLVNAKFVQGLNYGYIQGQQEEIIETLKPFGVEFKLLSDLDLVGRELSEFDAIVVGPNAYIVRDQLRQNNRRLLDYVEKGGTLIVQYQGYGYENQNFTPYPFKFSHPHDRVTYEDAPIEILRPDFMFFRLPNAISQVDYEDWVRDRGLYFFGEWDKRYQTFIASADPGLPLHPGGLMGAYYGRGTYLYCGYSFFRQLPAGVLGAFRQFANILALPVARILERIDFLKRIYLFSALSEEQLEPISRLVEERWYEAGSYICHKGEIANELYIVYQGEVGILSNENIPLANSQLPRLALRKTGEWVGELAFLGDIPRTASLRANTDVELLILKGDDFVNLLYKYPDMGIRLNKMLVRYYFTHEDIEEKP